jgi:adenylate cyclase
MKSRVAAFRQYASRLLRFARKYRAGFLISGVVCLVSLGLYVALYWAGRPHPALRLLVDIEFRTLDIRFQLRGPGHPSSRVVIVAIDQESQDLLGRWPFPRSRFAEAVDVLREAGARVIAFDVNFPQPDQNSALQAVRQLRAKYEAAAKWEGRNRSLEAELARLEAEADNDQKFAAALERYENAILGYFFMPASEAGSQDPERVKAFLDYLSFQAYPQIINPQFASQFEGRKFGGLSPNLSAFAQFAKNFGFFNVIPESDGVVRREPVILEYQGGYYPSLDIAAVLAYQDRPLDEVKVFFYQNGLERIDFGSLSIPTDPEGFVQIDFYGPRDTFPTVSLADVVQRKLPPAVFRDRLVLIGPTATGIGDMVVTPFQTAGFPGVEVHANFISNLLQGQFIRRGLRENLIDMVFIILFSLGAGFLLSVLSSVRATAVLILFLGFFFGLAYYLFATQRIWIAAFLPTATLIVNYAGIVSYRFFFEERERKKVRGAFQQYVSPAIITQMLERPELLRLGGEEKELTAMFADIRGFTGISEGLSPRALVDLLNEHLSEMTEVIFHHWGTLDKYIGDAIMAFWGAPYPQSDHAERACRAGLDMLKALRELQTRWVAQGRPHVNMGIGINTGPMVVGNMGSNRRFNFTIMGDNVNLASRLEGLNKVFGTRLIISEMTYQAVQGKVIVRELDLIRVKGKKRPVKIYELLGTAQDSARERELLERFHAALEAYRRARWDTAAGLFGQLLRDYPEDGPTRVFVQRCVELLEQPPAEEWDGVYVMKEK